MINPAYQKPALLIPARRTREIDERTLFDGSIETALDEESLAEELNRKFDVVDRRDRRRS